MTKTVSESALDAIDVRHFYYFSVVAEENSLRRAAEQLGVSQPSISAQIHQLEEALGAAIIVSGFSQIAVMAAKETVNRAFEGTLSDGLMFERRLFHALFATEDQKEGMDAFVNKRQAVFKNL